MKTNCFIILLAMAVISCSQNNTPPPNPTPVDSTNRITMSAGWQRFKAPQGAYLADVAFLSPDKGYIFGTPACHVSVDSGKTWAPVTVPTGHVATFNWYNNRVGHGTSTGRNIYTTDAGATWRYGPVGGHQLDIAFVSPAHGYSVGESGLLQTQDTGATWTSIRTGNFTALHFLNNQQGWAAGNPDSLYQTNDGGATWLPRSKLAGRVNTLYFLNNQQGFATFRNSNDLLRTTDGGTTWTTVTLPRPASYFDIQFINASLGYICGGPYVLKTTNGGQTWAIDVEASGGDFIELHFLDANHGWAVQNSGYVFRWKR
jgi:photosystem II stability/assembly factor-like uncharacterized protein